MAPGSHTATSGVTWGRPSARTVEIQNSSAVSSTRRVSSHPVATASGSLKRGSIFVTGSFESISSLLVSFQREDRKSQSRVYDVHYSRWPSEKLLALCSFDLWAFKRRQ